MRCSVHTAEATRKADAAHGKRNTQHTRRAAPSAKCTQRGELSAVWHTKRSASYPTQRKPSNAAPRTPTHFSRCILPFGEQSACLPHVRMRGGENNGTAPVPHLLRRSARKASLAVLSPEDQRREPAHHDSNNRLRANRRPCHAHSTVGNVHGAGDERSRQRRLSTGTQPNTFPARCGRRCPRRVSPPSQ